MKEISAERCQLKCEITVLLVPRFKLLAKLQMHLSLIVLMLFLALMSGRKNVLKLVLMFERYMRRRRV